MNKHKIIAYLFTLISLSVFSLTLVSAQVKILKDKDRLWKNDNNWTWTTESWTADEKPYRAIRLQTLSLYNAKKLNDTTLTVLRNKSRQSPENSLLRFRWATYAYYMGIMEPSLSLASSKLMRLHEEFVLNPSPKSYEYTRMRYLVESLLTTGGLHMARLGERLLKRNPTDKAVKYYLVSHLFTGQKDDEHKALRYAQDLVRLEPKKASYYSLLAFTYERRSWRTKSKTDAQLAIANYRKYLQMAKPTGMARRGIEKAIERLSRR